MLVELAEGTSMAGVFTRSATRSAPVLDCQAKITQDSTPKAAIIVRPSTLLSFHNALKKRKYQQLYSLRLERKPGPKGPAKEILKAIVEMKQRNPRYGCPRIAHQINLGFGLDLSACAATG